MDSHIQTAPLLACPSYPNSVAWSDENLVAVASVSVIIILNPARIEGPRGLIKLASNKPFSIGVVKEEDLFTPSLMPISLLHDTRPCARSVSWSPMGFAPNSGCLLAICTIDGRVKLYHSPYCEYSVEWVEVIDISEMLLDYLIKTNFGECNASSAGLSQVETNGDCTLEDVSAVDPPDPFPIKCLKRKASKALTRMKERHWLSKTENGLPLITANQYASRSAMLSSLIVAWSSALELTSGNFPSCKYAVLAVGGKSGRIYFWRFCQPECYTIEHGTDSVDAKFIGILQAHCAWITAISWEMLVANSSKSLALATGSSDGSVRLWITDGDDLITSSEVKFISFQLLKEVVNITCVPVSTLSMAIPMKAPDKIVLAIGKGSGSLEVWICDISSSKFQSAGMYNAHDQVITGLSWAFDGCCLYSCSQDNAVHCWDLSMDSLDRLSNLHTLQESGSVVQLSDPCLGLALSHGNLMIAVIRSFDSDLLNPMYQARTQKAAVEFFWIGEHPVNSLSKRQVHSNGYWNGHSGSSIRDLSCWESNILWSLDQYHNIEKPLVLWDIISALLALKQTAPDFLEHLLLKWLSSWSLGFSSDMSFEKILFHVQSSLPKLSIRQIHLLNIMCRRLTLSEMKMELPKDGAIYHENKLNLWNELLIHGEKELRVRLVTFSLRAVLFLASHVAEASPSMTNWLPVGVAQMEQWISVNKEMVEDRLLPLVSRIDELGARIKCICEKQVEESCSFCSGSVPFESPEVGVCKAAENAVRSVKSHKLRRCAVSMKLCSVANPLWICMCCQRSATRLLPSAFFTMYDSSKDGGYVIESFSFLEHTKPLCPFCGILLQRCAPNFLLSVNPV